MGLVVPYSLIKTHYDEDDKLNVQSSQISDAQNWIDDHLKIIVYPKKDFSEVLQDWNKFQMMPVDDQLESDEGCMRIFGMTNEDMFKRIRHIHYADPNYKDTAIKFFDGLNNVALESSDIKQKLTAVLETAKSPDGLSQYKVRQFIEAGYVKPKSPDIRNLMLQESPYFTPDEMQELGVYSKTNFYTQSRMDKLNEETTMKEWFEAYTGTFYGVKSSILEDTAAVRLQMLKELSYKVEHCMGDIDSHKQTMLELGWNPEIPFTEENRLKAFNRIKSIMEQSVSNIDTVDLTSFIESANDTVITEEAESEMKPVFVVFLKSDTLFNKVITKVTKGSYGHVAIGFNPSLKSLYSFNVNNGGFSKESIYKYKDAVHISVMCFFARPEAIRKMKSRINSYSHIKSKTSYGFQNLISCLTKKASESSLSMVCSGFVDYMMKVAGNSATKVSYSVVNPNSLKRAMDQKKRFYKIYKGSISGYNPSKVKNHLDGVLTSFRNEAADYVDYDFSKDTEDLFKKIVGPYLSMQVIEEQDFFIQFDNQGDLLIGKKDIDFESEYAKSHKLLLHYDEAKNYDGMKYELAKLWYMNSVLQDKIYHSKGDRVAHNKARSKILNDFKKYMKVILKEDNKFNFQKYYKNSPYGDDKTRIKSSTIKYTINTVKQLAGLV